MSFDWNGSFEWLAARFMRETGMMAPGKSEPPELHRSAEYEEERRRLWDEFMYRRIEEAWTLWHQHYGMLRDDNEHEDKRDD